MPSKARKKEKNMKQYALSEILDAVVNGGQNFRIGEAERQKVLHSPNLKEKLETLREVGEEIRGTEIHEIPYTAFRRFFTDGDRSEYEHSEHGYFIRRKKLATYAFLYWLYRKPEDLDELSNAIWAILNEYTWCLPAHIFMHDCDRDEDEGYTLDLFASETGQALAETVSLVGEDLPKLLLKRIKREINERIFESYVKLDAWWKRGTNNWVAVCSGSVGMTAMLMIDDKKRVAEDFIAPILKSLQGFLSGFSDDGICLEGTGYWHYGFGYFTAFSDMLDKYTNGKIDLFDDEKVHKISTFLDKSIMVGGNSVPFSDAVGGSSYEMNTLGVFLRKYPDTRIPMRKYISLPYEKRGCYRFALLLRSFTEGAVDTVWDNDQDQTGIYTLESAEWFIHSAENGVSFVAKGGNNDESHNHNDVGEFAIFGPDGALLEDLGSGKYCKEYFAGKRYEFLEPSSLGHSVPIVNGNAESAGIDFKAKDLKMTEKSFELDISGAYNDEKIHNLSRRFTINNDNEFRLTDTYSFETEGCSAVERFVTRKEVTVSDGTVTVSNGKQTLTIACVSGQKPTVSTTVGSRTDAPVYLIDYPVDVKGNEAVAEFLFTVNV